MAQDFWASSGFRRLGRAAEGCLVPTSEWLAVFLEREELAPPPDAGPREHALHERLRKDVRAIVAPGEIAAIEDADARANWAEFLRFRDRVLSLPTLEATYRDLYARPAVDLAPPFVDELVRAIVRGLLDGSEDPWGCRAAEMLFRRQRVSTEGGQVLAADAQTLETFAATGGFGNLGRLMARQGTALPEVKMDILNAENAPFYFLRDELHSFVLDITVGREGAAALARVLELWIAHLAGARVTIEPLARIDDERWRWHVGLDAEATAILNALYRGEEVAAQDLERLVLLFALRFRDDRDAHPEARGKPVYLAIACRPDRSLRIKPQNLLVGLPLAQSPRAARG